MCWDAGEKVDRTGAPGGAFIGLLASSMSLRVILVFEALLSAQLRAETRDS